MTVRAEVVPESAEDRGFGVGWTLLHVCLL